MGTPKKGNPNFFKINKFKKFSAKPANL